MRVSDGKSLLFVPRLPDEYAVWMGSIPPLESYKERYQVDEVHFVDEVCTLKHIRKHKNFKV